MEVGWQPPARGRHHLPTLTLETRYPLGTFRVWAVWRPAATVAGLIRNPKHTTPVASRQPQAGPDRRRHARQHGEFDGVRACCRGDPLKKPWSGSGWPNRGAGLGRLVSRDSASSGQHGCGWTGNTGTNDTELRASRLTAWVQLADPVGLNYGLRLPGQVPPTRVLPTD